MFIGGIQPCSFSDYPGRVAAVLFTQDCNFRCPFCYNGSLLAPKCNTNFRECEVLDFLKLRQNQLSGVVITGGEPTEQVDLPKFIGKINKLGFAVKLDTNGSHPKMIELLIQEKLVDYLAIDIKAPLNKYDLLCGVNVDTQVIRRTISIIAAGTVPHHFRTTYVKPLLTRGDLNKLLALVPPGSKHIIQPFIAKKAWNQELH